MCLDFAVVVLYYIKRLVCSTDILANSAEKAKSHVENHAVLLKCIFTFLVKFTVRRCKV